MLFHPKTAIEGSNWELETPAPVQIPPEGEAPVKVCVESSAQSVSGIDKFTETMGKEFTINEVCKLLSHPLNEFRISI